MSTTDTTSHPYPAPDGILIGHLTPGSAAWDEARAGLTITATEIAAVKPGFCYCGCGGRTPLATRTNKARGNVAGQSIKYLKNHHRTSKPIDMTDVRRRFLNFVTAGGPDACWEWQGDTNWKGYGRLSVKARNVGAHRVSYQLHHGDIPEDLLVRHTCDNPPCVNPAHLVLGTYQQNSQDAKERDRLTRGEDIAISRLTERDVQDIRRKFANGATKKGLAREYGVARYTIQQLLKGDTWAWLPWEVSA